MDDDLFDSVVTEITKFYRTITTPFLNRFPDDERERAIQWGMKIMDLRNYGSMLKYLTFLTFMIINGRLVSPFDSDPETSPIPPLPVHFGEGKMLEYIEKVVAQCQATAANESRSSQSATNRPNEVQTVLSNDEMAFLAAQPVPGVGIRLYMAASTQPFAMWSKPGTPPQVIKYDVPAKDVVDRGISMVKEKFYSSLDGIGTSGNQNGTSRSDDSSSTTNRDGSRNSLDGRRPVAASGTASEQPVAGPSGIPRRTASEESMPRPPGASRITSNEDSVPDLSGLSSERAESMVEEQRRLEAEIEAKSQRWFPEDEYIPYRRYINNFIRAGMSIDATRRMVHRIMRVRYNNPREVPLFLCDSMDESFPKDMRIQHLRMRYYDVLTREYGITNEGDLHYLSCVAGIDECEMERARKIIRDAEEGKIDPTVGIRMPAMRHPTSGSRNRSEEADGGFQGTIRDEPQPDFFQTLDDVDRSCESCGRGAQPSANFSSCGNQGCCERSSVPSSSDSSFRPLPERTAPRMGNMPPSSVLRDRSDEADNGCQQMTEKERRQNLFDTMNNMETYDESRFGRGVDQPANSSSSDDSLYLRDIYGGSELPPPRRAANESSSSSFSFDEETYLPLRSIRYVDRRSDTSNSEPDGRVYPFCPKENCSS